MNVRAYPNEFLHKTPMITNLSTFIQSMPKAEIHIHLEGAIRPETVLKLARRHGRFADLPGDDVQTLRDWFTFTDFDHFIEIYMTIQDLLRTADDFALIVYENGAEMARQNIRYREMTVTPYTHLDHQEKGLTLDDLLSGLERGRRRARADFGVEMRWIFDCHRNLSFAGGEFDPRPAEKTLEYALAGRTYGVVGFGLGGGEAGAPPAPFAPVFRRARAAGLRSVPHAGETVGPESVWGAVNQLGAHRIGHGVRAIEDPRLLALLRERGIPLEVCISSNVCLGVYGRSALHPFPHLDKMGLTLTVNGDDPPLFNTTLCREYELLAMEFDYGRDQIARIARNAFAASAAEPDLKARLLAEFDDWRSVSGIR